MLSKANLVFSSSRLRRRPQHEDDLKNDDDLKNEGDLLNEDNLKKYENLQNEDNLNKKTILFFVCTQLF